MKMKNQYIGSDFEEFLDEEGIKEEVEANAIKKVIAYQIKEEMDRLHLTKTTLAKRMHTSRSAVDRLFTQDNESLTLVTLSKVATALGKKLKIELV
jgi:hypothetical protein